MVSILHFPNDKQTNMYYNSSFVGVFIGMKTQISFVKSSQINYNNSPIKYLNKCNFIFKAKLVFAFVLISCMYL